MLATGLASSYLIRRFREFYALVARLKIEAQYRKSGASDQDIWQGVVNLLEAQVKEAEKLGRTGASNFEEALYVMAALGDEVFIQLDWPGREAWKSNLLESRFFGSHVAGEQFFERLEQLLQRRDPQQAEFAAIYLMALSLGFHGKYYQVDDEGRLPRYRRQLYAILAGREPGIGAPGRRLFEDPELNALEEPTAHKLPDPRRWLYAVAAALAIYALCAHGFWYFATDELRSSVSAVLGLR